LYETKCLCDFYYNGENKRTLGRPTFNQNDRIQSENDRIEKIVITTTQLVKNNNEESVKQQNRTTPIQFQNSL